MKIKFYLISYRMKCERSKSMEQVRRCAYMWMGFIFPWLNHVRDRDLCLFYLISIKFDTILFFDAFSIYVLKPLEVKLTYMLGMEYETREIFVILTLIVLIIGSVFEWNEIGRFLDWIFALWKLRYFVNICESSMNDWIS